MAPLLISAQSTKELVQQHLDTYFTKDETVKNFAGTTKDSLYIYADAKAKNAGKRPEFSLSWKQVQALSPIISRLPEKDLEHYLVDRKDSLDAFISNNALNVSNPTSLKGLRVAIDPGHIGGTYSMAFAESRCMTLQIDSAGHPDSIKLIEGNLAFQTALILKKKLEDQGATVMFTRKDTGLSALDITYWQWKKRIKSRAYVDSLVRENLLPEKDVHLLRLRLSDKTLFKIVFGSVDMAERAKKMNAFKPDVSVVIHYNVNETNTGWTQTTPRDYTMTFVGGCVISKDLETVAARLNFLRLLISPDIDNSVSLSSKVVQHLSKDLGIPIAHKEDATYLYKNCISTPAEGVYSRDLALSRLIHGTSVYGEALYQDNNKECMLLCGKGADFKGCDINARITQVANAYYEGIVDYVNSYQKK